MITYEPPEQREVNVGERVEWVKVGIIVTPCWCGDPATVQVHDGRWWVSCSCESHRHDAEECPEVGGSEGFETKEEAAKLRLIEGEDK